MLPEPGKLIAGKYRLERLLAAGGMGAVWVARHVELEVAVAVKLLTDTQGESRELSHARFKREAKAAAQLKSPHVTLIYDFGVHEESPYIVMELLEGEDLDALIARQGRLPLERARSLLEQACRGLGAAHDLGVIHRDLKPSNIFLARAGGQEIVKLLDFGIAKELGSRLVDSDRTRSGVVIGSPRYMSPEQTQGGALDIRSDLWSLGVVAFEMVTGCSPFDGEYLGQIITAICTKPPPRATLLVPDLPPAIDRFFERALAREPAQRFGSAAELADAFSAVAEGRSLPDPITPRITAAAAAFAPTVVDPRPRPGDPTRVASATRPSPGAEAMARAGDTTARAIEVVSAGEAAGWWRRNLRTWLPIAAGLSIAAAGWFYGSRREQAAESAAEASAPPQAEAAASAPPPFELEPSAAPSAAHAPASAATSAASQSAPPRPSVAPVARPPSPARPPTVVAPAPKSLPKPVPTSTSPKRDHEFGI